MKKIALLSCFVWGISQLSFGNAEKWKLIWADEFNGSEIDSKFWTKIERGKPDWQKHMSSDNSLYDVKDGNLILRGKVNTNKSDPVPYITGGIQSKGKYSFCYGKIEIRAKVTSAQGAWPALWMMPETKGLKWPAGGEIDLMEHLNFDNFAYQTVHSAYTYTLKIKNPKPGSTGKINKDDYNIYGMEWYPEKIVFFINGKETFTYPKIKTDKEGQWPFTHPFYIIMDMQLGGSWVGKVNPKQLPVEMKIDWVRVYQQKD